MSLVEGFHSAFAEAEQAAAEFDRRALGVSKWSVGDHLAHVAAVNRMILAGLRRLEKGKGEPAAHTSARADEILGSGTLPRGRGVAPEAARPKDPERDEVLKALSRSEGELAAWAARSDELKSWKQTLPHHHLGPLKASQWLEFALVHMRHHLAIVQDIVGA